MLNVLAVLLDLLPEFLTILITGTIVWIAIWIYIAYITELCP